MEVNSAERTGHCLMQLADYEELYSIQGTYFLDGHVA